MRILAVIVHLIGINGAAAFCQTACVSDMQCKGFVAVSELYMCLRGCCSSPNTVIADYRAPAACLQHNIEGFDSSAPNAYPWMSLTVYASSTDCNFFNGVLIAPNWIATDDESCSRSNNPDFTHTVYFFINDPVKRQIYQIVNQSNLISYDTCFQKIEYIGVGQPLAIAPIAVRCDAIYPTQATMLFWIPMNSDGLSRAFVQKQITLQSQSACRATIQLSSTRKDPPRRDDYFCFNDNETEVQSMIVEYDLSGSPIFLPDAQGNLQYIGENSLPHAPFIIERISARVDEFQNVAGGTCA